MHLLTDSQKASLRALNRGWFNTTVIRRRDADGQIVSMRKSGTHWLKYMLGLTISRLYDVPPPLHIQDDSVVGHPKSLPKYDHIPQLVCCHSDAHYLMRSPMVMNAFDFPKYLVMVRHPQETLVSDYEKHREDYGIPFATYIRAGPRSKLYFNNIWSQIRFMNGWGAIIDKFPERTMVVRYEDMQADTVGVLARLCDYFGVLGSSKELLREISEMASKSNMAQRSNPNTKRSADGVGLHVLIANNIWSQIRFMNGWGAIIDKFPERTMVVRYEDMQADTVGVLARLCDYFGVLGSSKELLREISEMASKSNMAQRSNPNTKRSAVRISNAPASDWYTDADKAYTAKTLQANVRHNFGYRFDG